MKCSDCGFDVSELSLRVEMTRARIEDGQIVLHCPFCPGALNLDLKKEGVFLFKDPVDNRDRIYRWRGEGASALLDSEIRKGRLIIQLDARDLRTLSMKDICYPKVPVFRNRTDGGYSAPRSPVQKKFLDLVNLDEIPTPTFREDRGEYETEVFIRGIERRERYRCPALVLDPRGQASDAGPLIGESYLAYWPNIRFQEWNRFFLRFGGRGSGVFGEGTSRKTPKVAAWAKKSTKDTKPTWVTLSRGDLEDGDLLACVESRPRWLSVEYENAAGEPIGGGIWEITPPGAADRYPSQELVKGVGVDFGTSNTFVAFTQGEPEPLKLADCTAFVFEDKDLFTPTHVPDTWPPARGFGRMGSLLPSELLTRRTLEALSTRLAEIDQWRPVVDFGIPTATGDLSYDEKQHVIGEFKWQESVTSDLFRGAYRELQQLYLEFLLLVICAELAHASKIQGTLSIKFSYPLAFSEDEKAGLTEVVANAAKAVTSQTGVKLNATLEVDEAQAAAQRVMTIDAEASLYVDIGGGSTDVALLVRRERNGAPFREYKYIDSVRYAGAALLNALNAGKCLQADLPKFRRLLREEGDVMRLKKRGTVFLPSKLDLTTRKTGFFYSFLLEYVARLIAAHIVTGEWEAGRDPREVEAIRSQPDGYRIALYPFGNGWGFGEFITERYPRRRFASDLTERVGEIVREWSEAREKTAEGEAPADPPRVKVMPLDLGDNDPKSVVAMGLLGQLSGQGADERGDWGRYRTIVGWTTQVGRYRRVAWHAPIAGDGIPPTTKGTEREERIAARAELDCPDGEAPMFPRALELYSPHQLDPGLARTRRKLVACLPLDPQGGWFLRSPLHVMLEELFKPDLERIS